MYLAEIHGKLSRENENKEDILTSNVFSFFKYTDRKIFLYPLLQLLDLNISIKDCVEALFRFWPTYADHTQPDLVILVGKYYILVEDKYFSSFSKETARLKHQLVREIEGGLAEAKSLDMDFKILTVTADYFRTPEIFDGIPEDFEKDVKWINWQGIAYLLYKILEKNPRISPETKLFAEDLYTLFLKKNLRSFEGIRMLSDFRTISFFPGDIFFNAKTAQYRGDFIGFIQALEVGTSISMVSKQIFYLAEGYFFESLAKSNGTLQKYSGKLFFERNYRDGEKRTDITN